MAAGKEEVVDAVEEVPDATPHKDESDDGREISGEILRGNLMHSGDRVGIYFP